MAAGDIQILPLSGSTDGIPITIGDTQTKTIHTATDVVGELDLIWLYFSAATDTFLTVEWGGTETSDKIDYGGPFSTGRTSMMISGFPIRGGLVIKCANAAGGNIASITGVVHRYAGVTESPEAGGASIQPLSESLDGRPTNIPNGTPTLIHTSTDTPNEIDLVTLYATTVGADPSGTVFVDAGGELTETVLDGSPREFTLIADKFPSRNGIEIGVDYVGGGTINIIGYVERYNNG